MGSPDDDQVFAVATVVLADRPDSATFVPATMPDAVDPSTVAVFHPPGPQGQRAEVRPIIGRPPSPDARSIAWVREMTGRRVERVQLTFLADQIAPRPLHWESEPRGTLTMSVYLHATDDEIEAIGDDYVLIEAVASRGVRSTAGQHTRLWSRAGALLATTEQLIWYR